MTLPLITVVIPTYARPRQLTACLTALAAQRCQAPWEVVVVDDGSLEPLDAIAWATLRGSRSGRVAWQYVVELAGRAGKAV